MIARIQKRLQEKAEGTEKGFTLVELLVVIIIIGILAAIAIPLYLNQQQKAKDSAAKSDLANARIEVASALVDTPDTTSVDLSGFTESSGVDVTDTVTLTTTTGGTTFCISANAAGGDVKTFSTDETGALFENLTCS